MRKSKRFMRLSAGLNSLVLAVCLICHNVSLAAPSSEIQTLTVAFLFNFMKLSEWPTTIATNEFVLCATQSGDYTIDLDSLAGKEARNRVLKIKHLVQGDNVQDCQLLFIPDDEKPIRVQEWLKNIANLPILTVSGTAGFLDQGGMIELINEGDHLQFEVNLDPVEQVGIKLSSQMLQIARDVKGK